MSAKLNSFTLIETIVAMLIGGIVLSMASYTYFRINEWYFTETAHQQHLNTIMQLEGLLRRDCQKSNQILQPSPNELTLDSIHYTFTPKTTIRQTNFTSDTFALFAQPNTATVLINKSEATQITIAIQQRKKQYLLTFLKYKRYQSSTK